MALTGGAGDIVNRANNLADVEDADEARSNLGINQGVALASSQDLDLVTSPGSYYTPDTTWTNGPTGVSDWLMLTVETMAPTFANDQKQTATALQSENTYVRCRVGGTWSAWPQLLTPAAKADKREPTTVSALLLLINRTMTARRRRGRYSTGMVRLSLRMRLIAALSHGRVRASKASASRLTLHPVLTWSKFQPRSQELLVKVRSRISITPVRALPQAANFALSTSL